MDGYKKIKVIGTGTFGTVYLCGRNKSENKIVLKEINRHLSELAIHAANNEINILQTLKHPNIIEYHKHFISKHFFCIIMEYATKGNLYEYISKRRQTRHISQNTVLNIYSQILLGLNHIHSKNIIHRDLKCENILITGPKYDVVKIADFGISKLLETNGQTNTVIGTPNYLAPEICDGQPYDFKSDIWALGCILYELCALERMFEGNISNVVLSISRGLIKTIDFRMYNPLIQEIINFSLQINPQFRPSTNQLTYHPLIYRILYALPIDLQQF